MEKIKINEASVLYKPEDVGFNSGQLNVLDTHLQKLIERQRIQAASYLICKDDKIIAHKSMGKLSFDDEGRDFQLDSIRRIASVTKLFTAVSIMQLVEKGHIYTDQSVGDILDEFKHPMFNKITFAHLLTHTSGIGSDPGVLLEPFPRKWEWFDCKDWIKEALRSLSAIDPGIEFRYSSTGFSILAEIVSRVSGIHYEKYVIENILKPLGMNETFFDVPEELSGRVCLTSEWEKERFQKRFERTDWAIPRGGGGLNSTLSDLCKFGRMILNKGTLAGNTIISRKTVELMTRNHVKGVKSFCWGAGGKEVEMMGLGFGMYSDNSLISPGSFAHEGAGQCGLFMDPVEKMVLAYTCPLCSNIDFEPEAVINLRNIVWAGII